MKPASINEINQDEPGQFYQTFNQHEGDDGNASSLSFQNISTSRRISFLNEDQQQTKAMITTGTPDYYSIYNIKNLLEKDKKSPLDLKNLEMILKNHTFFKECKNTLSFSHYVSLIRSLRYRFVAKGEIVYSFGDRSEEMWVILEGSFFAIMYNHKEIKQIQGQGQQDNQLQANNEDHLSEIKYGKQQQQKQEESEDDQAFEKAQEFIDKQELQAQLSRMKELLEKDKTNQKECLELEEIFGENYAADEIVSETLRVGASLGEYELIYNKRRTQSVIARQDSHLIIIPMKSYLLLPKDKQNKRFTDSINFLLNFEFFRQWNRSILSLLACFEQIPCELNQVIYTENEPADYLYFVYQGDFEISKRIDLFHEENKKALEFADIPMYAQKLSVKNIMKVPGDASERIRCCICGPNSYFGDEELLVLQPRQSSAVCVSETGLLYRLSLKNLVKVVCNQNNIWSQLQGIMEQKKKWLQKQQYLPQEQRGIIGSSNNNTQWKVTTQNNSPTHPIIENNNTSKDRSPKINQNQTNPLTPLRNNKQIQQKNTTQHLQAICKEASDNIQALLKKKAGYSNDTFAESSKQYSFSVEHSSRKTTNNSSQQISTNSTKSIPQPNINPTLQYQPYLCGMETEFVSKLSPVKISRYFNRKQELLNRRFFTPRAKNLIDIQQTVLIAKHSHRIDTQQQKRRINMSQIEKNNQKEDLHQEQKQLGIVQKYWKDQNRIKGLPQGQGQVFCQTQRERLLMSDYKDNISRNSSLLHITEVNNNSFTSFEGKANRNTLGSSKLNPSFTEQTAHSPATNRRNIINSQINEGGNNDVSFTNSLILSRNNSITKKNKPIVVVVSAGKKSQEASRGQQSPLQPSSPGLQSPLLKKHSIQSQSPGESRNKEQTNKLRNNNIYQHCVRKSNGDTSDCLEQQNIYQLFEEGGERDSQLALNNKQLIWNAINQGNRNVNSSLDNNNNKQDGHALFQALLEAVSEPIDQEGKKTQEQIAFENRVRIENRLAYERQLNRAKKGQDKIKQISQHSEDYMERVALNRFTQFYTHNKTKQSILDRLRFQRLMLPALADDNNHIKNSKYEEFNQLKQLMNLGEQQQQSQYSPGYGIEVSKQESMRSKSSSSDYNRGYKNQRNSTVSTTTQQSPILNCSRDYSQDKGFSDPSAATAGGENDIYFNLQLISATTPVKRLFPLSQYDEDQKQIQFNNERKRHNSVTGMILDEISVKAKKRTDQRVYNRVFRKGDVISNKTGGFNMIKPCPSRFIAEL